MRLGEERISHISHLLTEGAAREGLMTPRDQGRLLKITKEVLTHYCRLDEEVDRLVRTKLASYSRGIQEGTREWDVLYQKHFEEEMRKKWK
jgi:hypothetical protein